MKEEEIAGIGYILTFFSDVESLTDSFSTYTSILLSIKEQIPDINSMHGSFRLPEDLRIAIINSSNILRKFIIRCTIKADAMKTLIPALNNANLKNAYYNAIQYSIINFKDAEKFTFELNSCFADGTLKDTLFNVNEYSKLLKK